MVQQYHEFMGGKIFNNGIHVIYYTVIISGINMVYLHANIKKVKSEIRKRGGKLKWTCKVLEVRTVIMTIGCIEDT